MWPDMPAVVVEKLAEGFPPKEIQVEDDMLYLLLQPLAEELGFAVKKQSRLNALDQAKRKLQDFMGGRGFGI